MKKTVRLHISDMPAELQAQVKASAAMEGITLKEWVKQAMMEKLFRLGKSQITMHPKRG